MRRAAAFALATLVVAFGLVPPPGAARAADGKGPIYTLFKAGTLIDGTGSAPRRNVGILVKDGRIESVGENVAGPPGTATVDLSDFTVLPGFIDCHTHLTSGPAGPDATLRAVTEGPADAAIRAVGNARRTLEAGFTTVRNVGASDFVDVALKHAIDAGEIPGPRMITAT